MASHGVTLLGDDLYSNQPLCELALQNGVNFILSASPIPMPRSMSAWPFGRRTMPSKHWKHAAGMAVHRSHAVSLYERCLVASGPGALSVHWLEITRSMPKQASKLYANSFITNHRLQADNVSEVARAGRGRWKIENENNNVLKTKGYHIEHNFGHGQQYLAAVYAQPQPAGFLFHTVMQWCDVSMLLRHVLARRQTFFDDYARLDALYGL